MGRLMIKQLEYQGDNYFYKSEEFHSGLNIIEGTNGGGKTTFSNLICYALGIYVEEFDKSKLKIHTVIVKDTNNFVVLHIEIDKASYKLKRFFNTNTIYIEDTEGNIDEYPIFRNENQIFSDWLLNKLGFPVVEIYQGTKRGKINFSDLFRLIHYDQKTNPEKIYKAPRKENNFVTDSEFMRKVILEMLLGYKFSEYYKLLGEFNTEERKRLKEQSKLESYIEMAGDLGIDLLSIETNDIDKAIKEKELQIKKVTSYKEGISRKEIKGSMNHLLIELKKDLVEVEFELSDLADEQRNIQREISDINKLKEGTILEITQLKKIIVTHGELNLFTPDTCPYCLKNVDRQENYCICGNEVDESEYERFFYSSEEYIDILKSKQKSVNTFDLALDSCKEQMKRNSRIIEELTNQRSNLKVRIKEGIKDIEFNRNTTEINTLNDKLFDLNKDMYDLNQKTTILKKFEKIVKAFQTQASLVDVLKTEIAFKEKQAKGQMGEQIKKFNKIYNNLMHKIIDNIETAEISSENYMPIINKGEYIQASVDVATRFMYYLSLLNLSIADPKVPFPRFLLIDTPENLGIDKNHLDKSISKLLEGKKPEDMEKFQIILTTGIGKFPQDFKKYKVGETLLDDNKLLKKRVN